MGIYRERRKRDMPGYGRMADFPELNLLEVRQDVLRRPFGTLSNGEQTKVLLAAFVPEGKQLFCCSTSRPTT